MKKIMGAVQSVLIAMILLAIIGTGVILYFQMSGKAADSIENDANPSDDIASDNTIPDILPSVSDNAEDLTDTTSSPAASAEHNYTGTVLSEASCTKNGAMQYVCADCGNYYIEPIKAKGHKPGDWVVVTKATKEKDGLRQKSCLTCKRILEEETISKDTVKDPAHVHKYTSSVTTEAKCTTQGTLTFKCDCGKSYTEAIPTTDHPSRQTIQTDPACDKEGSVITSCAECGAIISHDVLPAVGHRYGSWKVVTKATATTDGQRARTCSVCKKEETEAIPATGSTTGASTSSHTHRYTSAVTTEETCTTEGVTTFSCTSCDYTYTESIPALGHAPGNWTVITEATEAADGLRQKLCRRCGEVTSEEVIPALQPTHEHRWGTPVTTKQPTCQKTGTRKYTCTECGDFYTASVDKIAHKVNSSGVCTMCGETIN